MGGVGLHTTLPTVKLRGLRNSQDLERVTGGGGWWMVVHCFSWSFPGTCKIVLGFVEVEKFLLLGYGKGGWVFTVKVES